MNAFNVIYQILMILGSLGLFLFGMKLMSESLQKVAGGKINTIISAMTSNRFKAVLSGFTVTALIQASSATTVMLVSFVNAGLITLSDSIAVTMGANIGTTIKIWFITLLGLKFSISQILLPIIGLSLPFVFSKNSTKRSWGEFFLGFALLFLGIDFIIQLLPDFQHNETLITFINSLNGKAYLSVILFVVFGLIITMIIQSSSATITLTLILSANGVISYEMAAAMVLGENIGTTITANIAAIIANKSAKKAAFAHTLFNVLGVALTLILFYPFVNLIDIIVTQIWNESPYLNLRFIPVALCFVHTLFNLINTLIWINFIPLMEKVLNLIFTESKKKEKFKLKNINTGLLSTSELSMKMVKKEVADYASKSRRIVNYIPNLLIEKDEIAYNELIAKIRRQKEKSEKKSHEIRGFLVSLSEREISIKASNEISEIYKILDNIELIINVAFQMSKIIEDKNSRKLWFTQSLRDQLTLIFELTEESLSNMIVNLNVDYHTVSIDYSLEIEQKINKLREQFIEKNNQDILMKEYTYQAGAVYINMLASYEKIADLAFNVNEIISGIKKH